MINFLPNTKFWWFLGSFWVILSHFRPLSAQKCSTWLFDPFIGLVELENRWQPSHEVILVGFKLLGTSLEVDVEISKRKKSWIDLAIWSRNQCSAPLFNPFIGLVELENRWKPSHEVILVGFQLLGTFLEVDVKIQGGKKSWTNLAIWSRNQCSAWLFDSFIGLVEFENRWQPSHGVILVGFQLLGTFLEVDVEISKIGKKLG